MVKKSSLIVRSLLAVSVLSAASAASKAWADCASPQTFTVTNLADDGSPDTLRFLVGAAQDCDVIEVPAGTYLFDAGGPGFILVNKSITIRGEGAGQTIIDANGPATTQGVFAVDTGTTGAFLTLEGVTLQNAATAAVGVVGAGGLHVSDSSFLGNKSTKGAGILATTGVGNQIIIDRCLFQDNETLNAGSGVGSAVFSDASAARISINDTIISNNHSDICAVVVQAGELNISRSHIVDNDSTNQCGGVAAVRSSAVIADSEISRNKALTGAGGGAIFADGTTTVSNSQINDNEAAGLCGGIDVETVTPPKIGSLTIVDSTVDGNKAGQIGGGVCGGLSPGGNPVSVSIDRTTISNNLSDSDGNGDGAGGGLAVQGSVALTNSWVHDNATNGLMLTGGGGLLIVGNYSLDSNLVENNTANNSIGGGALVSGFGTIANSTFSGNGAVGDDGVQDVAGGGIAVFQSSIMTLVNSTIADNRADGSGGGLVTDGSVVYVSDSTITGNVADANSGGLGVGGDGGGVFNGFSTTSLVSFDNSIVAGNVDASAGAEAPDCFSDKVAGNLVGTTAANVFQSLDGCGFTSQETPLVATDPLLDTAGLADNDGPSVGDPDAPAVLKTVALQSSSPAVDSASVSSCTATDERGVARPIDGNGDGEAVCDLGAFEAAAPAAGTTGGETAGGTTGGDTTGGTSGGSGGGCSLIR